MKRYTPVLQPGGTIGMQSIPGNATGAWVLWVEAQTELNELYAHFEALKAGITKHATDTVWAGPACTAVDYIQMVLDERLK